MGNYSGPYIWDKEFGFRIWELAKIGDPSRELPNISRGLKELPSCRFRALGFRGLGFSFRALGFRALGFRVSVLGSCKACSAVTVRTKP